MLLLTPCAECAALESPPPIDETLGETAKGHGSISIGYQNTYVNGMFLPVPGGEAPIGTVRVQSIDLGVDYNFADRWSVHVDLPYIEGRYRGPVPHCPNAIPTQCAGTPAFTHPHPESQFLDDGNYHGTWQDWGIGVAYHANIDDYYLTPSITAYLPSHGYTFFANAAVGQDLKRVEVAATLAHQFEFSEVYYRIGLGHVFSQETLGQSIDYNKVDLELGYFLNEALTFKVFGVGKKGNGFTGPLDRTSELWYRHDQRAKHNYANVGGGVDYRLNDKYTLSSTVQKLVWGEYVFDFRYVLNVTLTRAF